MGHYIYKSIPDAKFEVDSSFNFGDMTSQNFHQKKGTVIRLDYLPPENGFNFKKKKTIFKSRIVLLDPKLTPHVNFNNFQAEENFSFSKFLRRLVDERAAATPLINQFC